MTEAIAYGSQSVTSPLRGEYFYNTVSVELGTPVWVLWLNRVIPRKFGAGMGVRFNMIMYHCSEGTVGKSGFLHEVD